MSLCLNRAEETITLRVYNNSLSVCLCEFSDNFNSAGMRYLIECFSCRQAALPLNVTTHLSHSRCGGRPTKATQLYRRSQTHSQVIVLEKEFPGNHIFSQILNNDGNSISHSLKQTSFYLAEQRAEIIWFKCILQQKNSAC